MIEYDKPLDIKAFEDLLRQAISVAKSEGIHIRPGRFGVHIEDGGQWQEHNVTPGVCPLGAVILLRKPQAGNIDLALEMSTGLGVYQYQSFYVGFDGSSVNVLNVTHMEYYQLGQKFRREYEQGLF